MPDGLDAKEYRLTREIHANPGLTQRELSERTGLSLGTVNLLLKRLSDKDLVDIKQINGNKARYILTPKGRLEKSRESHERAAGTLQNLRWFVENIQEILLAHYRDGLREFHILGTPGTAEMLEMALAGVNLHGARIHRWSEASQVPPDAELIFSAAPDASAARRGARCVSLIEEVVPAEPKNK